MDAFRKFRYKARVVLLLTLLLVCLLLNNISNQESFKDMEIAATSIYEDRLLPSTYIFEIREYLYKGNGMSERQAIAALLDKYEHTVLTKEEAIELKRLRSNLGVLFSLQNGMSTQQEYLAGALANLSNLLHIQAGEGEHVKAGMSGIAHTSTLLSYFEVCLLIIVGGLALSLIGFSKNVFNAPLPQNSSLN